MCIHKKEYRMIQKNLSFSNGYFYDMNGTAEQLKKISIM